MAYLDYVALHQTAVELFADSRETKVLTVWPASSELSTPWLGYTKEPLEIAEIDSLTWQEVIAGKHMHSQYILMFPRRVCKAENPLLRTHWLHLDYFRGMEELTPEEVAGLMSARVIYYGNVIVTGLRYLRL